MYRMLYILKTLKLKKFFINSYCLTPFCNEEHEICFKSYSSFNNGYDREIDVFVAFQKSFLFYFKYLIAFCT